MTLQYFVTASDTGNRIPIEVDKSTPADLAATKESWQTDWTSEFIGDPALEKYTAKTENGEIVALGAYRETESSMFVYIEYIESHPKSNPTLTIQKKYLGIGRMMIAFGIQLSIDSGKNGVVTFEAKMLKENESELEGTVKFMFQPAEENFLGSKNMIENGILENPKVDAALAYHVAAGKMPVGIYMYNDNGTMMYSVDGFQIDIKGKGSHGAYPQNSIDPINIGVHVYLALEAIMAREVDPTKACVMTVGQFQGGTAENIIPDVATLKGTIRSNDKQARELMVRRMKEVATKTAESYGGTAEITMLSEVPPLIVIRNLQMNL